MLFFMFFGRRGPTTSRLSTVRVLELIKEKRFTSEAEIDKWTKSVWKKKSYKLNDMNLLNLIGITLLIY